MNTITWACVGRKEFKLLERLVKRCSFSKITMSKATTPAVVQGAVAHQHTIQISYEEAKKNNKNGWLSAMMNRVPTNSVCETLRPHHCDIHPDPEEAAISGNPEGICRDFQQREREIGGGGGCLGGGDGR